MGFPVNFPLNQSIEWLNHVKSPCFIWTTPTLPSAAGPLLGQQHGQCGGLFGNVLHELDEILAWPRPVKGRRCNCWEQWYAGWWLTYPSEKYEFVSWEVGMMTFKKYMERMFQTTNQCITLTYQIRKRTNQEYRNVLC